MSKTYDYKKGWEELDAHIKILITSYKCTLSDTKKIETKEKIKIVKSVLQQIIKLMEDIKERNIGVTMLTEKEILEALSLPFTEIISHQDLYMTDRIKAEIVENFRKLGLVDEI